MTEEYQTKPVTVQAICFNGTQDSQSEVSAFVASHNKRADKHRSMTENGEFFYSLVVPTIDGRKQVNAGDYVTFLEPDILRVTTRAEFMDKYTISEAERA